MMMVMRLRMRSAAGGRFKHNLSLLIAECECGEAQATNLARNISQHSFDRLGPLIFDVDSQQQRG